MITENKITEIFCIADDFCKELEKEFAKKYFQIVIIRPKGIASV